MARKRSSANRHATRRPPAPPRQAVHDLPDEPAQELVTPPVVPTREEVQVSWERAVANSGSVAQVAELVADDLLARLTLATTALEAQVVVGAFLGVARQACPRELPWTDATDLLDDLFESILAALTARQSLATGAVVRVLAVLAPQRTAAAARAWTPPEPSEVPDLPWVADLARPRFIAGWLQDDVPQGGRTVGILLAEGSHPYRLTVVVDGSGAVRDVHLHQGLDDPLPGAPLDVDQVTDLLSTALTTTPAPGDEGEFARVARTLPVLAWQVRSLTSGTPVAPPR